MYDNAAGRWQIHLGGNLNALQRNKLAGLTGAFVALSGASVLLGWQFNISILRAPIPRLPAMTPNTAIGVALLGCSLFLLSSFTKPRSRWMAIACLTIALLLGTATLLEYLTARSFGIDSFLFGRQTRQLMTLYRSRPSPQTCIDLMLLAIAMGLCQLTQCNRSPGWIVQILAAASLTFSFVASVGYLFGITFFYGVAPKLGMALHTALAFSLLSIGLLLLTSETGFLSEIFSEGSGGMLARRVLPATVLVPLFSAVVLFAGQRHGLYESAFTVACLIVICTVLPAAIAVGQITRFNRQEAAQSKANEQMHQKSIQLMQEQAARSAAEMGSERYRLLAEERDRLLLSETAARERAEEATKAKDDFLAVLSHELRTPLTPVLLTVSLMERQPLTEEMREDMRVVRQQVEIEARLIDDLLDLTRIVHHKLHLNLETVDIHGLILDIEATQKLTWDSAQLQLSMHAQSHQVLADPVRLRQIIMNLLDNARKFSPAGSTIAMTTYNSANRICISVIDNGIGINPSRLSKIFDAFDQGANTRERSAQGGLGLGLTISRGLAEAQGGSISAASDGLNQGSTFTIELPLHVATPLAAPVLANMPVASTGFRSLRILLVEDHPATREVMTRILERSGHRVAEAGSVREAATAGASQQFDLVISDVGLPDGTGHEVMRNLRSVIQNQQVVGIAVSGYGMESDILKSRGAGFAEHLVKPIDFNKLTAAIERHALGTGLGC
jgi:signal transduction histidine kinase